MAFSFAIVSNIAITTLKYVNKVGAKYKGIDSLNLKNLLCTEKQLLYYIMVKTC